MICIPPRPLIIDENGKRRRPVRWQVEYSHAWGRMMAIAVYAAVDDPSDECLVEEFCMDIPEAEVPTVVCPN